jgi:hypothetical protein
MTISEGAELHKRVERYEAAVEELLAAHEGVRGILVGQVLFARWKQLGAELGFSAQPLGKQGNHRPHDDVAVLNQPNLDVHDSWAS